MTLCEMVPARAVTPRSVAVRAISGAVRGGRVAAIAALLLAAACSDDPVLPGERLAPRDTLPGVTDRLSGPPAAVAPVPISLPAQTASAEWTHRGAGPAHLQPHAALGAGTTRVWSADIGAGSSRRHRIAADPVVAGGRIFTLDAGAGVAATGTGGAALWSTDLTPPGERAGSASGGGLASEAGRIYATTGYGELVALDAATGAVLWRQRFPAAIGGAPTVRDGRIYVVGRDDTATVLRAADGRIEWQFRGAPSRQGVTGAAAPAVDGRIAVFPFASGQIAAVMPQSGLDLWRTQVAGQRLGRAYAQLNDLTGEPVIAGDRVYAGSAAGRLIAVAVNGGALLWTANEGAVSPVQPAGNALFLVSDDAALVRLDAATGNAVWAVPLPQYVQDNPRRQQAIHAHYGPVLAGGRLFTASSDGLLRAFDPASGALVATAEIPGGAASAPVVAGGVLYVVGRGGALHAYR